MMYEEARDRKQYLPNCFLDFVGGVWFGTFVCLSESEPHTDNWSLHMARWVSEIILSSPVSPPQALGEQGGASAACTGDEGWPLCLSVR